MPRVISTDEAKRLGAVPVGPRVMTRAEAEAAGAVPVASDVETRITSLGGVKQADGTYVVPGENGGPALHLDAEGNRLDAPAIGEESTGEAVGNRVLATAASGAQGFVPQLKGVAAAASALGSGANVGEAYRKERDSTKATVEQARGKSGLGYDILGSVLAGGVAAPETAGARIALSAGLGAVNAASGSNVDLTKDGGGAQFAGDVALGAGIGAGAAGLLEGAGAAFRAGAWKLRDAAGKVAAKQALKDAAAVEAQYGKGVIPKALEVAEEAVPESLPGRPGYEMAIEREAPSGQRLGNVASSRATTGAAEEAGMKLGNVSQRGYEVIEGSRFDRILPPPEGPLAHLPQQATPQDLAAIAAQRTRDYFSHPLWATDIRPAIERMAPRYGKALVAAAAGSAFDEVTDSHWGKVLAGGLGFNALGSTFAKKALGGIMQSPRVQRAVLLKLAPLFETAAASLTRGAIAGATAIFPALTESALGPPDLAAQQLIARGGLASLVNDNGAAPPSLNAPQSPLDRAIQQTTGVTLLAAALHDGNESLAAQLERMLNGKAEKAKPHGMGDLSAFAADPGLLIQRLADNTGNLATIAPGIAAELAATTQRAADYLAKVSTTPAPAGPLAPAWVRSDAEKRSIRLATNVVAQPLSILESAAAGMLVPEQVAALNAVYPMLGRQISDMALDQLTSGPVSYRARLMVSLLTGVDADGTLASIGPNQQAIRMQSQKPSNMGTPAAGADKLTVAQRSQAHQSEEA